MTSVGFAPAAAAPTAAFFASTAVLLAVCVRELLVHRLTLILVLILAYGVDTLALVLGEHGLGCCMLVFQLLLRLLALLEARP